MGIPRTSILQKDPKAADPFAPRRYGELHRVTERVYILRNITNSSFVIGDRSVAVIDTQVNAPSAAELLRLIRTVTDKPVEYVINTHYHWDHTNGNALFKKEGATVVSSKLTREFMVSRAPRQKEFLSGRGFELGEDPFLPEKSFENELTLDLGGMPLRLFFAGSAETDDATAVHVPKESVLMSGDTIMTGSFPIFGQPCWDEGLQGPEWARTVAKLMGSKPAHIVPGHGPLAHEAEIALFLRIQDYFLEEVGVLVRKGLGLEAVLKDLEPRLPSWIASIPLVWGTPRYAILRVWRGLTKKGSDKEQGWQQFKPSAVPELGQMAHEAEEGGDIGLKLSILKKSAELHSNDPDALAAYADALIDASKKEASVLEKGDFFDAARRAWETALELDAQHVPTLLGKGRYLVMMAYRGGDDPKRGMELLQQAKAVGAGLVPAHGRPQGAPLQRQCAEIEFYLGMGHRRLGDEKAALAQFDKALAFDAAFMPARLAKQS